MQANCFILQQAKYYQKELSSLKKQENLIKQQTTLQVHQNLPKKHTPNLPTILSQTTKHKLNETFNNDYKKLFFQHLSKVVTHNTLTLEITKEKVSNIVHFTEQQLASSDLPQTTLAKLHSLFLAKCHLDNHICLPELSKKLTDPSKPSNKEPDPSKPSNHPSKRKTPHPQPPCTKRPKHFLCPGPSTPTTLK